MQTLPLYKMWLRSELERRSHDNPRYSTRAFARALGMDPSHLSKVLHNKARISPETAKDIATKLHLKPGLKEQFIGSILSERLGEVTLSESRPEEPALYSEALDMEVSKVPVARKAFAEFTRKLTAQLKSRGPDSKTYRIEIMIYPVHTKGRS